jgi:hypothetical protein
MKGLVACQEPLSKEEGHALKAKVTRVGGGEINKLVLPMVFSNALGCHNDLSPLVKYLA